VILFDGSAGESSRRLRDCDVQSDDTHSREECQLPPASTSASGAFETGNLAKEERLASAVRTILECIGEDPNREGLLRTPTRYAQALLWMTRGYEESLPGE
jgi:hypothetical protein